jgi:hypothetical protein
VTVPIAIVGFLVVTCSAALAADPPPNLALNAQASATSEHSAGYLARCAIDGKVPAPGEQSDLGQAWCVRGDTHRDGAEFALTWTSAVTIGELVYFGRTAWFAEECWKDCEIVADGTNVVAKTRFAMGAGPQRVSFPNVFSARQITLKFRSSYGGLNPGASEIQVFGERLPDTYYASFKALERGRPEPGISEPVPESTLLAGRVRRGELGFDELLVVRRKEINPSHVYTYHVEGFGAGGGLGVVDLRLENRGYRELVASPEGQILDCDVSYDGRQILFSWRRRKSEGYQVFTVNRDGSGLRQLTSGEHHNYNACWLPDGGIAFLSTRSSRFAYCWISPVGVLHRMERDGTGVQQLSANIVNDFTPSVLNDGRIIYSRWEYVDKPAIPIQSLWTIHPDGTMLAGYFGNRVLSPATFMEARSIPNTAGVLCTLTSHNGPARGAIGIIDVQHGNNAAEAIRNLTPWVAIGAVAKGDGNDIRGPYESPFPISETHFLLSRRGTVLVRDYEGTERATLIGPADGLGCYNPMPLARRPKPAQVVTRTDPDIVAPGPAEGTAWATVVLQDIYRGLEPQVKRGEVKQIAVIEEMKKEVRTDVANRAFGFQFPVISCGATYAAKTVWGFAPVAEDGSAAFRVPAQRPIYFLALDGQGRAVQRMRTFTHLMPGETQGCAGCHESRSHSAVTVHAKLFRPADELAPPEWGVRGFDYASIVQRVWDKHCASCHGAERRDGGVDLCGDKTDFFNVSYEVLARGRKRSGEAEWESPFVNWIPTYNGFEQNILEITPKAWGAPRSRLADLILSGHPDRAGKPMVNLAASEIRRVLTWIDLNVPYYGTSETENPNSKGCRRVYPTDLDRVLGDVAQRRCASCHERGRVPREFWTRIENPQRNAFLLAPLARTAGGTQKCGAAVFPDTTDPDYRAILQTFDAPLAQLRARPRMDMAGAVPASVDRSCLGDVR